MAHKIVAHSLTAEPRQKLTVPMFSKFLDAHLDFRFNLPLIWTLEDDTQTKTEKVEFFLLANDQELPVVSAKYLGSFKSNAGATFVFVSRESDHPMVKIT